MTRPAIRALGMFLLALLIARPSTAGTPGRLDPAYGRSGLGARVPFGAESMPFVAAAGPGGTVTVVGKAYGGRAGNVSDIATRYSSRGALESHFGSGGVARFNVGAFYPTDVAVARDGSVAILGTDLNPLSTADEDIVVVKLNEHGMLDRSFGGDGHVVVESLLTDNTMPRPLAIRVQPDGKILILSSSSSDPEIFRLGTDGSPDPTFGIAGRAQIVDPTSYTSSGAMWLNDDGTILLGSVYMNADDSGFSMARMLPNGLIDPTFGEAGFARFGEGGPAGVLGMHVAANGSSTMVSERDGGVIVISRHDDTGAVVEGGIARRRFPRGTHVRDVAIDGSTVFIKTMRRGATSVARYSTSGAVRAFGSSSGVSLDQWFELEPLLVSTSRGLVVAGSSGWPRRISTIRLQT